MKVLIVDDDAAVARAFAAILNRAGHDVDSVGDGRRAGDALASRDFDVVVCDWMLPDFDGPEVVRRLRAQAGAQPRVVLVSGLGGTQARNHALHVGADAYLVKPVAAATLVSMVAGAPAPRALVVAAARAKPATTPGAAATTPPVSAGCAAIRETRAWTELERAIAATLSAATGVAFERSGARASHEGLAASQSMVDIGHLLEFRFGLTATGDDGRALASTMLGDTAPTVATVRELLGELCNNVLGATKTAMSEHAFQFTLGLADVVGATSPSSIARDVAPAVAMSFRSERLGLGVLFGVRAVPSVLVMAGQLRENMVMVESVFNGTGSLLVPAGTRLTSSAAERLVHHLAAREVRVCDLA